MSWFSSRAANMGGWIPVSTTLTYSAAETSPNWCTVTASGDVTSTFAKNRLIKFTNDGSVKHGIIMRSAYATGTTTLKIFLGADTLANSAITSVYIAYGGQPDGFPDLSNFTLTTTDTTQRTQASPVNGTWYSVGPISIIVPPGDWVLRWKGDITTTIGSATVLSCSVTLSTSESAETDERFSYHEVQGDATRIGAVASRSAVVALEAETTYYLIMKTGVGSVTNIYIGSMCYSVLEAVPRGLQ